MPSSKLQQRTLHLVRNRSRLITLKIIAKDTGLSVGFLEKFLQDKPDYDPGVCKVEKLYNYFAAAPLAFGDE